MSRNILKKRNSLSNRTTLSITGMTCGHCVMSVKRALGELEGVTVEQVAIGSATVLIGGQPAARMGDMTAHGGSIVIGFPTVMIGP